MFLFVHLFVGGLVYIPFSAVPTFAFFHYNSSPLPKVVIKDGQGVVDRLFTRIPSSGELPAPALCLLHSQRWNQELGLPLRMSPGPWPQPLLHGRAGSLIGLEPGVSANTFRECYVLFLQVISLGRCELSLPVTLFF